MTEYRLDKKTYRFNDGIWVVIENEKCPKCGDRMIDPKTNGGHPATGQSVQFYCGTSIDCLGVIIQSYNCLKEQSKNIIEFFEKLIVSSENHLWNTEVTETCKSWFELEKLVEKCKIELGRIKNEK